MRNYVGSGLLDGKRALITVATPGSAARFAGLADPHQHRATSMQIHTDKLPTLIDSFTGASFVVTT